MWRCVLSRNRDWEGMRKRDRRGEYSGNFTSSSHSILTRLFLGLHEYMEGKRKFMR